jgi:prepilin-type N-terminal cleavage/methylation domain-containing protein
MKKGFSLIELLVALTVLSIIMLIAVPKVSEVIISSKNKAYAETKKNIEEATQLYRIRNSDLFPDTVGERYSVDIAELKDAGLIKDNIFDPRDKSPITNGEVIVELLSNGEYSYNYYSTNYVSDGLLLWYDGIYHGNVNNTWEDRIGNYDATLYDFDYDINNGWVDSYLKFDGTNYAYMPSNIGYTTAFSAFATVRFTGAPVGGYHIVFGGTSLELSVPTAGQIRTGLNTSIRYVSNHGSGLTDGNWHHVGFTFDGTTKKSYIDGVMVGEQTVSGTLIYNVTDRSIGRLGTSNSYYLNGNMASVHIYNRALSDEEIEQNYNIDRERFNF